MKREEHLNMTVFRMIDILVSLSVILSLYSYDVVLIYSGTLEKVQKYRSVNKQCKTIRYCSSAPAYRVLPC